jgi:TRAP-type transport system periplasmic protein
MTGANRAYDLARGLSLRAGLASVTVAATISSIAAQGAQPITMRISTATLNDAQHEWMKRFAVAIDKNTRGRIKPELYPASQLGAIARQIEGTQQGSIQAWVGPPEFLVGVDRRFEILGAPGLFKSDKDAFKVFDDPQFTTTFLGIAANRGLLGAALFFTGPASYDMRVPVHHLSELKGRKIRVLASQFQIEPLSRLGATGVPMSLGDVLPALQQGIVDGAYGAVSVFAALKYYDAAKYMVETRQAYFYSVAMLSKRWYDGLAPELQHQVMASSKQVANEVLPWSLEFLDRQRVEWKAHGGEMVTLPPDETKELMAKISSVGDDIVKDKPDVKPLWDMLVGISKR